MFERLRQFLGLPHGDTGSFGECLASAWLEKERGFRIVARNWRSARNRRAEIDLVARDGEVLVFVEVKTRSERATVSGFRAIDRRKRNALRRACDAYLRGLVPSERPSSFRFDAVEIRLPPGRVSSPLARTSDGEPVVRHFQNVPLFRKFYRR